MYDVIGWWSHTGFPRYWCDKHLGLEMTTKNGNENKVEINSILSVETLIKSKFLKVFNCENLNSTY
jgi:hypothetical protein